jgi:hypothetical protein
MVNVDHITHNEKNHGICGVSEKHCGHWPKRQRNEKLNLK